MAWTVPLGKSCTEAQAPSHFVHSVPIECLEQSLNTLAETNDVNQDFIRI